MILLGRRAAAPPRPTARDDRRDASAGHAVATDPDAWRRAADARLRSDRSGSADRDADRLGPQILALLPGISRSGVAMVAGLVRGLSHRDAARFSFLLATPVILAAGVLKLPDLTGPLGAGIRGQVLVGSVVSGSPPTCRCAS